MATHFIKQPMKKTLKLRIYAQSTATKMLSVCPQSRWVAWQTYIAILIFKVP